MKIGIVFAGQGAQYPGMGSDLYQHSEAARKVYDEGGEQVKEWCFNGTKEMLRQTYITQPSIFITTMAALAALREELEKNGLTEEANAEVMGYAGFSLGEYSALTAAGTIADFKTGLNLVTQRGNMMNEAGMDEEGNPKGGMVAAFGKRPKILETVETAREDGILQGANFNSPIQTVIAGDFAALDRFVEQAKGNRIKAKKLSVSTAFHCEMMAPAAARLKELLLTTELKRPQKTVYANLTGQDIMGAAPGIEAVEEGADADTIRAHIAEVLAQQAMNPVKWQDTIENMIADGADVFIEVGPGVTLSGIIHKINRKIKTFHVEDIESLEKTIDGLKELHQGAE